MQGLTFGSKEYNATKNEILEKYRVISTDKFDAQSAISLRINYLKNFLKTTNRKAYILGISGGVDSTLTGKLCQMACEELRTEGYEAKFVAMRLPANIQKDESDAQKALSFIKPDYSLVVNVGPAATLIATQGVNEFMSCDKSHILSMAQMDFNLGNVKARMRMLAQYQASAMFEGLVVGTDHNAEAVMGFFTLWGDGACDLTVLNGLNKRQIRLMLTYLGADNNISQKIPTADLEDLNPGKTDDEGFGFNYNFLDDFLEGKEIPQEVEEKIINAYKKTYFKRASIPGFFIEKELS